MNESLVIKTSLDVLREVYKSSRKNYSSESNQHNHSRFLYESNIILHEYFKNNLSDSYLYSCISFKSENEELSLVDGVDDTEGIGYNFSDGIQSSIKDLVNQIFKDAKNKKTINLTEVLLSKLKDPHDFYFLSQPCESYNRDFWSTDFDKHFLLSDLMPEADLDLFTNQNRSAINKFISLLSDDYTIGSIDFSKAGMYLHNYKLLEKEYLRLHPDDHYYLHLIRPGISEFRYNLLLSLATKKPLSKEEFALINFFLYRIVSQTAIEKIKEAERLKSLHAANYGVHVIKTKLSEVIRTKASTIGVLIANEYKGIVTDHIDSIDKLIKHAEIINVASKIAQDKSKSDILKNLLKADFICESSLFSEREFNLSEILNDKIDENNSSANNTKLNKVRGECLVPNNFLTLSEEDTTKKYWFNREFYLTLSETILENFKDHAVERDFDNILNISFTNDCIEVKNTLLQDCKDKETELTGIFGLFKNILEHKFGIAKIITTIINDEYILKIQKIKS